MQRQFFTPFTPYGNPLFPGSFTGTPFFPQRPVVPFFFLSPFARRPFYRDGSKHEALYHAQHHCTDTDTILNIAETYNVPHEILLELNPHIQDPNSLGPGTVVGIPRMHNLYVQKMYMEQP
jgi:hypothetical protein